MRVNAHTQRHRIRGRLFLLGLYALVALVAPLLHHDFECHLNSRAHCDACIASPAAASIESGTTLIVHVGPGQASMPESVEAKDCASRLASPGRAPPAETCLA